MVELRSHRVARCAYQRVEGRKGEEFEKKYGALAHKFPGMVLQNGLAQATGFLLAKGGEEHLALLDDLLALLRESGVTTETERQELHRQIIAADLNATLRLTRHTLEASSWLKRYVQGLLKIDATGENQEEQ